MTEVYVHGVWVPFAGAVFDLAARELGKRNRDFFEKWNRRKHRNIMDFEDEKEGVAGRKRVGRTYIGIGAQPKKDKYGKPISFDWRTEWSTITMDCGARVPEGATGGVKRVPFQGWFTNGLARFHEFDPGGVVGDFNVTTGAYAHYDIRPLITTVGTTGQITGRRWLCKNLRLEMCVDGINAESNGTTINEVAPQCCRLIMLQLLDPSPLTNKGEWQVKDFFSTGRFSVNARQTGPTTGITVTAPGLWTQDHARITNPFATKFEKQLVLNEIEEKWAPTTVPEQLDMDRCREKLNMSYKVLIDKQFQFPQNDLKDIQMALEQNLGVQTDGWADQQPAGPATAESTVNRTPGRIIWQIFAEGDKMTEPLSAKDTPTYYGTWTMRYKDLPE